MALPVAAGPREGGKIMKIYVGHSGKKSSYKKELYEPLRNSSLSKQHNLTFPYEFEEKPFNSKEFLRSCDLMIAEVSHPSTGLGMELGWASIYGVPIVCVYKRGSKLSRSLKVLTDKFVEYSGSEELISGVKNILPKCPRRAAL